MKNKWVVTRQCYWFNGQFMVEIAKGGRDYSNPDALTEKYPGEFEEFTDPVLAVETAIEIHKAWKKDKPMDDIQISHGCTGGDTIPFESTDYESLRNWASEIKSKLPKCDMCGSILDPDSYYTNWSDEKFCSENCVHKREKDLNEEDPAKSSSVFHRVYLQPGDTCYIGGTALTRQKGVEGGWLFEGSDDDMYFNGHLVEWDEEKEEYYYIPNN